MNQEDLKNVLEKEEASIERFSVAISIEDSDGYQNSYIDVFPQDAGKFCLMDRFKECPSRQVDNDGELIDVSGQLGVVQLINEITIQRPTINFSHPSMRKIIRQLREIFNELHTRIEASRDEDRNGSEPLNLSTVCLEANQRYIDVIDFELNLLKDYLQNEDSISLDQDLKPILLIWKLCHIIFIKSPISGDLLLDLQEWYQNTNNIDQIVQELLTKHNNNMQEYHISQEEEYWSLIHISVAQGRIDTARHLLSLHPSANSSGAFRAVEDQLRTMPTFALSGHLSLFEFNAKWEYWQKRSISVLNNENFANEPNLEIACKMLCADERTFKEDLKPIFNNWYYMMVSFVSYSNPTFNISDLHLASQSCIEQFASDFSVTVFDQIIYNIFNFDVQSMINDCSDLCSSLLFSAHFLDVLFLAGKLQLNSNKYVSDNETPYADVIHEQHLSEYAVQLLSSSVYLSSHQIAFEYLTKCVKLEGHGLDVVEAFIEKMPLTHMSERDANRLFNTAYRFNLQDQAYSIGRVMQMKAFRNGKFGTALGWNIRIKDASFGTTLAEKLLDQYFISKDLTLLNLTEHLSKEIIYCDRLIFLSKYREFLKMLDVLKSSVSLGGQYVRMTELKKAATLLVQLLESSNLVSYKYRQTLILDSLVLLTENALNEDQLHSLLRVIQSYENRSVYFKESCRGEQEHDNSALKPKWKEVQHELGRKFADSLLQRSIHS